MTDVTRLLDAAAGGDRQAAADLLPLVYDELRRLAAARMAAEDPAHTLQPTALVHEAYLPICGWSELRSLTLPARRALTGGGTSSRPPPRPCAASSSRPPAASAARPAAAT